MITVKLTHGLTYQDKTVAEIRLKPLSVGGELAAFSLTYWSQQIVADNIPSDIMTAQWLMDNLSTQDYHIVMAAQEDLRLKPSAATVSPDAPSAAEQ